MALIERREHKRSFRGELRGNRLSEFLRNETGNRSHAVVLSFMADVRELLRHTEPTYDGLFRVHGSHEFNKALNRFNRKIGRYKLINAFSVHSTDRWHFTQLFTGTNKQSLAEFVAIYDVIQLARQGLLDRVRQCEYCQDWFFALFSHQKCCGAPLNCRIKLFHSSEKYRQENRERAAKAYRDKKESEKRWLAKSKETIRRLK